MAKDSKKLVQAITSQEENFAQWYTDICVKAELVEYSSVKGFIILRPYGHNIGLKVSFINSEGKVETWEFQDGTFTDEIGRAHV